MDNYNLLTFDKLNNKKLATQMKAIKDAYKGADKSAEKVARALKNIYDNELYKDDFASFEECIKTFGIGKAQGYRVIKAVEVKDELGLNEFNMSQVAELSRLETDAIADLVERGEVATMSCKAIRLIVDDLKRLPMDDVDEGDIEPVGEPEEADTDEAGAEDNDEADDPDEVALYVAFMGHKYKLTEVAQISKVVKMLEKMGYDMSVEEEE